ncbi:MAG: hypothetical protein CMF74_08705 [Maricaulis sp.]|nr:hypothetical protein [Maricaulis sp.]
MNDEWLARLAYGLTFSGLLLWAGMIAATMLFGVNIAYPYSALWVLAAALPATGVALLFLIATANRDEETSQ